MKANEIIGLIMCITGALLGLYVGVWVCFIGGIVDVITQVRAEHLSAVGVAIGIAKVMFAALGGWLSAILLIIPGWAIMDN